MIKELFELKPEIYATADEMEMLSVLKNNGINCIIYGAGQAGIFLVSWIKRRYGFKPDLIVDRKPTDDNIDGVKIISIKDFENLKLKKAIIVISVNKYHSDKETKEEIDRVIREIEYKTNANYIVYDSYNIFLPYNLDWFHYVKRNIELFERTYNWLIDDLSKDTMIYYLRTIILGERYSGVTFPEKYKYWGIDNKKKKMFVLSNEEVLLNAGAARGDTIYQYLKCNNLYAKIIGIEASRSEYEKLQKNINILDKEVLKKIRLDNVFLGEGDFTIDNLYRNENISLINMDIEGAELSALKSGINTIQNKRPILAICAYHKIEDLIEIPFWIKSVVDNYVFTLRKYPSSWYGFREQILQQNELVLYAIPKERYIKM